VILLLWTAIAADYRVPDQAWPGLAGTLLSPSMGTHKQNQQAVIDGWLLAGGNGVHELWDIGTPQRPVLLATAESPHHAGEAESHALAVRLDPDGRRLVATISGKGVDLWDMTDPTAPALLSAVLLDGVDYGDNSEAVWGVSWQGRWLFAGGTNTGLHIVDTLDPAAPEVVARLTEVELGGVSAGPLWAMGDVLVVTTPKERAGVATVDVSDPLAPALLDAELPPDKSYIGGFYGRHAFLLTPLRAWDVWSDPTDLRLTASTVIPESEYLSFADGRVFIGSLRPHPGARIYALDDDGAGSLEQTIAGRTDDRLHGAFTDDQFTLPIGNLVALSDDELRFGTVLAVVDEDPDRTPPAVLATWPADGATGVSPGSRLALSLSDQIDTRSVREDTVILRPLDGGAAVPVRFGLQHTIVHVDPLVPLQPDTSYELLAVAGGLTDLVGNPLTATRSLLFSTGQTVQALPCAIVPQPPALVGTPAALVAEPVDGATYTWSTPEGEVGSASATARWTWSAPGRHPIQLSVRVGDAARRCSALQVVHPPLVGAPRASSPVAIDEDRAVAWLAQPDAGTVARVSLDGALLGEHAAGDEPVAVALHADGRAWVADRRGDRLLQLDADGAELRRIDLRHGAAPVALVLTPDETRLWVVFEEAGVVARVGLSGTTDELPLGPDARGLTPALRGLALSPDGATLLVTRRTSPATGGELYVVDTARLAARETIGLPLDPGPDDHDSGRGLPNQLLAVALSPDGARVAVVGKKDNIGRGGARDGEPLDPDNTVRSIVSWVSLDEGAEVGRVDLDDHEGPGAAVFSPAGDLLFVASRGTHRVDAIDAWSGRLVGAADVGLAPTGLALSEAGVLVVQDELARAATLLDVSGLLDGTDAVAPTLARIGTVGVEPLPADVLLGKRLFHDARDARMSQDGYLACVTCHLDGGGDGQVWDFTDRGEGLRNTTDLRGKRGTGHGPVHWTANFDEIQDFEHDIRGAFGGGGLMDEATFFADGHDDPLGTPKAGLSPMLDALAAYVATFEEFPRSPWRDPDGGLSDEAKRGRRVFERLDCLTCHDGPELTDSPTGARHDVGTITPASGARRGGPLDGLDTPTLYGLAATAPYLHDGAAPTLEEVLASHGDADRLSTRERAALLRFLLELEPQDGALVARSCGCAAGGGGIGAWWILLLLATRSGSAGGACAAPAWRRSPSGRHRAGLRLPRGDAP
jgi:cytochrome c peroxidase